MQRTVADVLRDQGRGVTGALLVVGLASLYTMETWWLGQRLPLPYLVGYALVGMGAAFVLTRHVGFERDDPEHSRSGSWRVAVSYSELLLQSFLAAYVILLLFGVVGLNDPPIVVVRLGLVQVVPLGFGASLSNQLLASDGGGGEPSSLRRNLATFAIGAGFLAFPIAPTREIAAIATRASWERLAALVVLSVLVVYLVLYELEFRGHGARIRDRSTLAQVGTAFTAYLVGVSVSVAMLAAFGHYAGTTTAEGIQRTIVLSFIGSIGASAGEVVL